MRMKEICSRTGLTDRAVRLYIENGLLSPRRESGYSGRESIIFDEENLLMLRHVAVLRRAGFAIADIKRMQDEPGCIMETVAAYREQIGEEIRRKEEVLRRLEKLQSRDAADIAGLAGFIESAAGKGIIPKEDTLMTKKEFNMKISRYILSPVSLILALTGCLWFTIAMVRVLLYHNGGVIVLAGGGYILKNVFTPDRLLLHWMFIPAIFCFAGILICLTIYIIRGRKVFLPVSLAFTAAASILILCLPQDSSEALFMFEFLSVRFFYGINLYTLLPKSDFFIQLLYFMPFIISMIISGIAVFYSYKPVKQGI